MLCGDAMTGKSVQAFKQEDEDEEDKEQDNVGRAGGDKG